MFIGGQAGNTIFGIFQILAARLLSYRVHSHGSLVICVARKQLIIKHKSRNL